MRQRSQEMHKGGKKEEKATTNQLQMRWSKRYRCTTAISITSPEGEATSLYGTVYKKEGGQQ